jgi:unsaturated chondroitin disaccharide hydrolase
VARGRLNAGAEAQLISSKVFDCLLVNRLSNWSFHSAVTSSPGRDLLMKSIISESKTLDDAGVVALRRAFDLCVLKTRSNIKRLADDPKSAAWAEDGNYFAHPERFFDLGNWTSSFFTGMALIAWRATEDKFFLDQTLRLAPLYREKAVAAVQRSMKASVAPAIDMHHDAGFLYTRYSIALLKLTGDPQHRTTALAAAEALYQRFNPIGGFIRAWGHLGTHEHENMAIIDCMMNLPLLYWASAESGNAKFHAAAVRQAENTLQYFVRPDDSVFHGYTFDLKTGRPLGGDNYCGFSVDSHWARGTGWAIYGFALSYRYTGHKKYLEASLRLARRFNQLLNGEDMPVWDFKLPPGQARLRDTSAAAVVLCAYQELEHLGATDAAISKTKTSLLAHLSSGKYLNLDESCPGILMEAQVGNDTPGSAQNAYTSWGDYFLMEALDRELHKTPTWW